MTQASIQSKFVYGFEFWKAAPDVVNCHSSPAYADNLYGTISAGWKRELEPSSGLYNWRSTTAAADGFLSFARRSGTIATAASWMDAGKVSIELACWVSSVIGARGMYFTHQVNGSHWCPIIFNDNKMGFRITDSGNNARSLKEGGSPSLPTTLTHFVLVVDVDTQEWKIYRSGGETASASWTYGAVKAVDSSWALLRMIYTNGGMAFLRYYNAVLTSTEVGELYNSGAWQQPLYVNPNYGSWKTQTSILIGSGSGTGSAVSVRV